jgi:hypothetical protein
MKLTERDKWIALVLPLAVVVVGYTLWYRSAVRPEADRAQQEYATAVANQVSREAVDRQREELKNLRVSLQEVQTRKAGLDRQAAELCGQWTGSGRQLAADQELVALFAQHHLHLIDESPAKGRTGADLPKSLSAALERLGWSADSGGQVRAFKLVGPYPQVLKAIQELARRRECLAIPIGLSMAQTDLSVHERQWMLLVWM